MSDGIQAGISPDNSDSASKNPTAGETEHVVWMVGGGAGLEMLAERGEIGSPLLDGAALAVGPGRAVLVDLAGDAAHDVEDPDADRFQRLLRETIAAGHLSEAEARNGPSERRCIVAIAGGSPLLVVPRVRA